MRKQKMGKKVAAAAGLAALCIMMTPVSSYAWGFGTKTTKTTEAEKTEEGYVFKSGETAVVMGAEADAVIKALGKTTKPVFEQNSCAYQGKDKVYTYEGFEVSTYPVNGKDHIASVYFTDDKTATAEGIKLGSTADEVIKAYGKADSEDFGTYRYKKGKSELAIYTTNKVVDGIEYLVVTE